MALRVIDYSTDWDCVYSRSWFLLPFAFGVSLVRLDRVLSTLFGFQVRPLSLIHILTFSPQSAPEKDFALNPHAQVELPHHDLYNLYI